MSELRFIQAYQTLNFSPIVLSNASPVRTATMTVPDRFVITKLVAKVFRTNTSGGAGVVIPNPGLKTTLRVHNEALDVAPITLGAAWGSAKNPAKLSAPWAIEKSTIITVETSPIVPNGVSASYNFYVYFTLVGYMPAVDEFNKIVAANNKVAMAPYQTQSVQISTVQQYLSPGASRIPFTLNFGADFVALRIVGQTFDAVSSLGLSADYIEAPINVQLITKSSNLNTQETPLSAIAGDAAFPAFLNPPMLFHAGDQLTANMSYLGISGDHGIYSTLSLIGFQPTKELVRTMEAERLGAAQG